MKNILKLCICACLLLATVGMTNAQSSGGPLSNADYTNLEKLEIKAVNTYQSIQDGDLLADWKVLQAMIVKVANNLRAGQSTSSSINTAYAITVAQHPNRQLSLSNLKAELETLLNN